MSRKRDQLRRFLLYPDRSLRTAVLLMQPKAGVYTGFDLLWLRLSDGHVLARRTGIPNGRPQRRFTALGARGRLVLPAFRRGILVVDLPGGSIRRVLTGGGVEAVDWDGQGRLVALQRTGAFSLRLLAVDLDRLVARARARARAGPQ